VAAAAMRPGPPVQPSRRRPPRRQHPQQLHRKRDQQQQQQQQQQHRLHLLRANGSGSPRALLVLLLLASSPLVLGEPESSGPVVQQQIQQQILVSSSHKDRSRSADSADTAIGASQLRNLTIGYLTAIKGGLKDRQGLAISGALTMALAEVGGAFFQRDRPAMLDSPWEIETLFLLSIRTRSFS